MQNTRFAQTRGPEVFYGYCHDSGRMRMMDYDDFMTNLQQGYSNLYQVPGGTAAYSNPVSNPVSSWPASNFRRRQGCDCHAQQDDCGCNCCIRCADAVQYAYCGETRKIPVTFDNDSRRERQVTVQLGEFITDGGRPLAWKAALSETQFTLSPCSQKTVLITVNIDCRQDQPTRKEATRSDARAERAAPAAVESCTVGYARINADGCLIRPLIVAVAVLPDHCGARKIGCLCGGCCD